VESDERGQKQTAYRILVASDEKTLEAEEGDLWNSGRVESDQTVNISYAGKPLASRQTCFWKVNIWDESGQKASWSKSAKWRMGLLDAKDWTGEYISFRDSTPVFKDTKAHFLPPARQYRKEFSAAKAVRRATIYATALGIYELHLNGERVGDACFAPGWSDYHQRAYYNAYDVTPLLKKGANALGAWVADGWYSGYIGFGLLTGIGTEHIGRYTYGKTPALMAQLEIEYADGSRETVMTDNSWKVTGVGPIQQADFLMGEFYDARQEMPGWSKPGFDDSKWEAAIRAEENGHPNATFYEFRNPDSGAKVEIKGREVDLGFRRPPKLEAFPGVPVKRIEEIKPTAVTSPTNGVHIFNLGQNFAGVVRLKVKGPAGTQIRLRYGEMLHPDGRLMTENLRKARATDFYVLRGDPNGETFTPRFTFHGFQYVELTGYPGEPAGDAITGIVLHSDTAFTSEFTCSDPMANRLFKNIVWTQRANFLDLPTDCPQRDERFGWTGDAQIYVRAATYNADAAAFYTKWLRELMESQRPSGTFPGYAPFPFQHGWDFGTAWCDAGVICPWTIYKAYGDTRVIEHCWEPMTKFIEWRKRASKDFLGVTHGNEWGDWLALNEKTPLDYVDTAYFAYSTKLMAEMAQAIGKAKQAAEYRELFDNIKSAFKKKYINSDGSLAVDTQTAYALALYMDLAPADQRLAFAAQLAKKIRANDTRMSTGFLGTRPLLPVLSSAGQHDLAVRLFQSRRFPSWGYEIEQGATTIWERWNSYTKDKGFGGEQNASMNSFAHYSFGAVCEWMFSQLAGIDTDGAGYQRIIIRPAPPSPDSNPEQKPIDWVRAHYDSIHGRIASAWKREAGRFELAVTIPANTTATVYLPASKAESITESGASLVNAKGVKFLKMEDDRALLAVESGIYRFVAKF
jgi:alpha-L-rhamnosidase